MNSLVLTTTLGSWHLHPIFQMRTLVPWHEAQGHKASRDQYSDPVSLTPGPVLLAVMYIASLWFMKTRVEVQGSSGRAHARPNKGYRVGLGGGCGKEDSHWRVLCKNPFSGIPGRVHSGKDPAARPARDFPHGEIAQTLRTLSDLEPRQICCMPAALL